MAPKSCCRRPYEFQLCQQPIPCTRCSHGECTVVDSPIRSRQKMIPTSRLQRRAVTSVLECWRQVQQAGDVVRRLTVRAIVHKETQFVISSLHDREPMQLPEGGSELHDRVVSAYRSSTSLAAACRSLQWCQTASVAAGRATRTALQQSRRESTRAQTRLQYKNSSEVCHILIKSL